MKSTADSKFTRKQTAKNRAQRESGQIVIFMALLLVFLVGMAGLAIDGGRLFFEYRDVQNATDAAIQAAVYAKCTGRDVIPAAFEAAEDNGLEIGEDTTVWVFNPPITGTAQGDDDYVEVVITSKIDPYFIQVVYHDDLSVSARAVGLCIPDKLANAFKGAVFAGGDRATCNNNVDWAGSTTELVGGVHSNGDVHIGGGDNTINGEVNLVSPVGEWVPGNVTITEGSNTGVDPMPFPEYFDIRDYRPDPVGVFDQPTHPYDPPMEVRTGFGLIARQAFTNGPGGTSEYHVFPCKNANDGMDRKYLEDFGLIDGSGKVDPGLYYSACNIGLSNIGDMVGVTMVAEGSISVSVNNALMSPYELSPALAMFSNMELSGGSQCSVAAINFSASTVEWHGILYAPTGLISASASDTDGYGAMMGFGVTFSGSDNYIEWDETLLPPTPPQIGVAE